MMIENTMNTLHLCGKVIDVPRQGHEAFGEIFYYMTISVPRLSGAEDILPVTVSEKLLEGVEIKEGDVLAFDGQVRSYNKMIEGAGRLLITAFAQQMTAGGDAQDVNPNQVEMLGTICKTPAYRTTPFGREIADLMVAVNRAYGKSDYIPCIAWGRSARFASKLTIGDRVHVSGRLQSRGYQKQMPDGKVIDKTAYEVSVNQISLAQGDATSELQDVPPLARSVND